MDNSGQAGQASRPSRQPITSARARASTGLQTVDFVETAANKCGSAKQQVDNRSGKSRRSGERRARGNNKPGGSPKNKGVTYTSTASQTDGCSGDSGPGRVSVFSATRLQPKAAFAAAMAANCNQKGTGCAETSSERKSDQKQKVRPQEVWAKAAGDGQQRQGAGQYEPKISPATQQQAAKVQQAAAGRRGSNTTSIDSWQVGAGSGPKASRRQGENTQVKRYSHEQLLAALKSLDMNNNQPTDAADKTTASAAAAAVASAVPVASPPVAPTPGLQQSNRNIIYLSNLEMRAHMLFEAVPFRPPNSAS